ncbi:membrane protein insertion efficiency factor YidD [Cardiobacterium hominis]
MKRLLIGAIRLYRKTLSPFIGQQCRFEPTCSHYGEEAIAKHGALRGSILTVWRILRCGPWSKGGYDPVPETFLVKHEKQP